MIDENEIKNLRKLVKICKDNGVSHFKRGDLVIRFDVAANPSITTVPQARGSAKKASLERERGILQEQLNLAELETETLHIENPVQYEEMLMRQELEKAE